MYRKRWTREKEKTIHHPDTPRTKTNKLLRNFSRKTAKKTLLFHNALLDQLRESTKIK